MKRFSAYFNKHSRLFKLPELRTGQASGLAPFDADTLKSRLSGLLQIQNDFFPCFDWTFPPPVLQPAAAPDTVEALFAETSVIPGRYSLYLHTPFCKTLCNFCYYPVFPGKGVQEAERYVDYLLREMRLYANVLQGQRCESVYLGGGTPTFLDDRLLHKLVAGLHDCFSIEADAEFTIEAAPATLPRSKVDLLKQLGINRLSYGIQTLDEELLAGMNRYYSVAEAMQELDYALSEIGNVNVDTMYGFEGESEQALLNTLQAFDTLGVPSLSIYALDKQRCESQAGREGPPVDPHYEQKIHHFAAARDYLLQQGYQPILQNIFGKPGQASYRHQLRRWDNLSLVGLGLASQGYAPRRLYQNTMSLRAYYDLLDQQRPPIVTQTRLGPDMEMARELASKLRFTELAIGQFNRKYGIDLETIYGDLLSALIELDYLELSGDVLRMTPAASYYNNIIPMLFAPDDFKQDLLSLPEEYLENFPIPRVLTRLGRTQSAAIRMPRKSGATAGRERRRQGDRRLFQDTTYLDITGGIDRRDANRGGRRSADHSRHATFLGEFV